MVPIPTDLPRQPRGPDAELRGMEVAAERRCSCHGSYCDGGRDDDLRLRTAGTKTHERLVRTAPRKGSIVPVMGSTHIAGRCDTQFGHHLPLSLP